MGVLRNIINEYGKVRLLSPAKLLDESSEGLTCSTLATAMRRDFQRLSPQRRTAGFAGYASRDDGDNRRAQDGRHVVGGATCSSDAT